jgi:hypothetical protein
MMNVKRLVALGGLAVLVTACSSDSKVDIGDGSTSQGLSAYADSWDGYVEAHQFEDDSDRVRLTVDSNGEGQVRLGDTALLETPSPGDPAPAMDPSAATDFAYPIAARLEEQRLRFEVDLSQRYQAWCELQTPLPEPYSPEQPDIYACARHIGVQFESDGSCSLLDTHETVDCSSHQACQSWCACTEESCTAVTGGPEAHALDLETTPGIAFDVALSEDGEELTGTLLFMTDRIAVRLQRQ